jgi:5-methyltetrahydropteroyltriglutamate--homocysteine methyltransferase
VTAIATTHTGSLPRPADLTEMLVRRDRGEEVEGLSARVRDAVVDVVARQLEAGLTVVNDGEASKINYSTYVTDRLDGFGEASGGSLQRPDGWEDFPEFFTSMPAVELARPACIGPIRHRGSDAVHADIANLQAALVETGAGEAFMTAASPGVISVYLENRHYATHEEYIWALAEAMKPEYDAIHAAGLLLQIDCPDLPPAPDRVAVHLEALDHATRDIPPERMRLHVCWGNYEGPHHHDVPFDDLVEDVLAARPAAISFEAANPRHAHEWRVFERVALPEGKVLIPGVIDSTTNYIEHPRLVADRIVGYARLVGPENVIAGTDCGFGTTANHLLVDPAIAWAKLGALCEGADLAARDLAGACA